MLTKYSTAEPHPQALKGWFLPSSCAIGLWTLRLSPAELMVGELLPNQHSRWLPFPHLSLEPMALISGMLVV